MHAGVWMIHSGIIILALGSVAYFSTKVEGDAPIGRRQLVISVQGVEPASMLASPGNRTVLQADDGIYRVQVASIDPQWELLSGPDAGKRAYSVTLSITTPTQQFMRQVIANHPEYTEDIIRTDDPNQPMQRAKKVNADGEALVDKTISITMDYKPQEHFYLMDSSAVYVRKRGERAWSERRIEGLPRFNAYVSSSSDVWLPEGYELRPDPLNVQTNDIGRADVLGNDPLLVTGYLPYAEMQQRRKTGGQTLYPVVNLRLDSAEGFTERRQLEALNPAAAAMGEGRLAFLWFESADAIDDYASVRPAMLRVSVPGTDISFDAPITAFSRIDPLVPFNEVEGTAYAWRVQTVQDNLNVSGMNVSVAIVEIRKGEDITTRWVFEDASLTRDVEDDGAMGGHDGEAQYDAGIEMQYSPGSWPAPITIAAGPGDADLQLVLALDAGEATRVPLVVDQTVELRPGVTLTIEDYAARTEAETRPYIVPPAQRNTDAKRMASMIQVRVPGALHDELIWLPYHEYPFETPSDTLLRFPYQPTPVQLAGGEVIELMFSRARRELPSPVVLDDFVITSHVGGFTGQTSSIRNWTSMVRFAAPGDKTFSDDGWSPAVPVSVNEPVEHDRYWFFQASWDPPMQSGGLQSAGLNYTILGVGNRHGVLVQLLGCCIAVIGMIYAFYIKPILKRRRQQAVYADTRTGGVTIAASAVQVQSNGFVREEVAAVVIDRKENGT
jgi:hypothetical protein